MGTTRLNFSASGISSVFTIIFRTQVSQCAIYVYSIPILVGAQPPGPGAFKCFMAIATSSTVKGTSRRSSPFLTDCVTKESTWRCKSSSHEQQSRYDFANSQK